MRRIIETTRYVVVLPSLGALFGGLILIVIGLWDMGAAALKLVDEIGGEPEAIAWLERDKGVAKGLRVRDWRRWGNAPSRAGDDFSPVHSLSLTALYFPNAIRRQ